MSAKDLSQLPEAEMLAQMALVAEERKKQEWASWVDTQYHKCKNARSAFEQQWYLNLAFNLGKQYVSPISIKDSGFRLTTPKAPPWRVRLVINKVRTAIRTECAKLTTSKPIPTVLPATSENEDFTAAGVSEQILKWQFATAKFEKEYRSWVWWGAICGNSFLKLYWDGYCKDMDVMSLPAPPTFPTGEPMPPEIIDMVPGLAEKLETPIPSQGKIKIEKVTPFHVFVPDLLSEDLEDQPFIMHVMTKNPLWVKQVYGIEVTPDSRSASTILGATALVSKGSPETHDSVLVKEVWIKPHGHKDFPEGGLLTVISGKIVSFEAKWPYPFSEYPFYKYDGLPTGGFYSDSIIVDLIPVQKEYNKKRSQMLEIQNTMGKPKLLYPKGSINPRMISNEPGQSIPYTPGFEAPIPMPGAEVPVSMTNEIEKLQQEFDDISSQHEISRGGTPNSAISSGTAIAYLQEQDDSRLTYQVASIENAMELLGKHYLHLASSKWGDNRVIKVTGKNDTFEALHWKQNMLRGNMDVKVQTGSGLPFSKAARTALLTEMMQNGFVDPQVGMEMLNFGGLDKVLDDALVDKRAAIRENLKMANLPDKVLALLLSPAPGPNGEPPTEQVHPETGQPTQFNGDGTPFQPQPPIPVNSWDDHEVHIQWHNHFRKTQEFELLLEDKKKAFEMHVQLHQMQVQTQMVNAQGFPLTPDPNPAPPVDPAMEEEAPPNEGGPPPSNTP